MHPDEFSSKFIRNTPTKDTVNNNTSLCFEQDHQQQQELSLKTNETTYDETETNEHSKLNESSVSFSTNEDKHHDLNDQINSNETESCSASIISSCSGKTSPINNTLMMMMMQQQQQNRSRSTNKIKQAKLNAINELNQDLMNCDYDNMSPTSSDETNPTRQASLIRANRDGSVGSQTSSGGGTARSSTSCKDNLATFLLTGKASKSKEVIPQRKRRDFIPNELKDEHYWERRRKNNLAAKRSREKRRLNDIVLETKVLELTNLNNVLKLKLDLIKRKFDMNDDELDKLFEENKHLLVVQETLDMSELLQNDDSMTAHGIYNDNDTEHLSSSSSTTSSSSLLSNLNKSNKSPHLESITDNDEYINSPVNSTNEDDLKHANNLLLNSTNGLLLLASSTSSLNNHSLINRACNSSSSGRSSSSSVLSHMDNNTDVDNEIIDNELLDDVINESPNENEDEEDDDLVSKSKKIIIPSKIDSNKADDDEDNSPPPSKRKNYFDSSKTAQTQSAISPLISPPPSSSSSSSSVSSLKIRKTTPTPTDDLKQQNSSDDNSDENSDSKQHSQLNSKPVQSQTQQQQHQLKRQAYSSNNLLNENQMQTKSSNDNETSMKVQYPLLYNQLCKSQPSLSQQLEQSTSTKQSDPIANQSLEQQNQIFLNSLLTRNNANSTLPVLMNTNQQQQQQQVLNSVFSELIKNEYAKKNAQLINADNSNNNNNNNTTNDLLNKILPQNNNLMEKLTMLLTNNNSQLLNETSRLNTNANSMNTTNNQSTANALIEKYKNLINKTNSSHSNSFNTQQLKSTLNNNNTNNNNNNANSSASLKSALLSANLKNTVNNLLQNLAPNNSSDTDSKTKNTTSSSSRKRHINQTNQPVNNQTQSIKIASFLGHYEQSKNKADDSAKFISSMNDSHNNDSYAYAYANCLQQNQRNSDDLNDMVSIMLNSSVAAVARTNTNRLQNQQQQQQQQRLNQNTNKNLSKNQAYNQLLMLHHQQQLQQQQLQQQHRLESAVKQRSFDDMLMMNLTSPKPTEHASAHLQSANISNLVQQQQFANFANQQNAVNNNNNNNNANGDNMPLKLRFKMLQLKTGEVN